MGKFDRYTWAAKPEPISDDMIKETINTDVVICGAGFSGVTAALSAVEEGLDVCLIEKARRISYRGFHIGVPNSRALEQAGVKNDVNEIFNEWMKICGTRAKQDLVHRYLVESETAMNWFLDRAEKEGKWPFIYGGDYHGGPYREFTCTHIFPGGGAQYVVPRLYDEAVERGTHTYFNTTVKEILKDGDRVVGVIAQNKAGEYIKYLASKGVVISTGGIEGNPEMCADLAPQALTANCVINQHANLLTGDGQRMGIWAGADLQETPWPCMIHTMAYSMYSFFFLMVNQKGKRFMNEDTWAQGKCTYTIRQNPDRPFSYVIFDSKWEKELADTIEYGGGLFWDSAVRKHGDPFDISGISFTVEKYCEEEFVGWKADTLEELAAKIEVPIDQLNKTITRYNKLAEDGYDADFGKRPELMTTVSEGPFYALKIGGSVLSVPAGLSINKYLNVLDEHQEPIPGLFAIGNVAGDMYAIDYPLIIAGNSHGRCLTFGYLVGKQLAGKIPMED